MFVTLAMEGVLALDLRSSRIPPVTTARQLHGFSRWGEAFWGWRGVHSIELAQKEDGIGGGRLCWIPSPMLGCKGQDGASFICVSKIADADLSSPVSGAKIIPSRSAFRRPLVDSLALLDAAIANLPLASGGTWEFRIGLFLLECSDCVSAYSESHHRCLYCHA